jgi:hypothetical protein
LLLELAGRATLWVCARDDNDEAEVLQEAVPEEFFQEQHGQQQQLQ